MRNDARRRKLLSVLALILAGGSLAACQVSVAAGALGGGLALGVAGWLLLGAGVVTTQAGCAADPEPDPDPDTDAALDAHVGPCLSDASVGPCLSQMEPDAYVGPCLSPMAPDAHVGPCLGGSETPAELPDVYVGPCLSPIEPDAGPDANVGPCLGAPQADAHVGPCLEPPAPDAHVGPCLSPPAPDANVGPCLDQAIDPDAAVPPLPPDASAARGAARPFDRERAAVLDRLLAENRLPPDVAARLRKS